MSMPFAILMVWRDGKEHIMDCYFCMINLKGIKQNKHHVQYPNVSSVIRSIPHGSDLPVLEPDDNMEYSSNSKHSDMTVVAGDDAYKPEEDDQPVSLTQAEFNDQRQDQNLSKESVQLLSSHLKEKLLLAPGTMFYWYRHCKRVLRQFFTFHDRSSLVYSNNIAGLIRSMSLEYDAKERRLFINSSSTSLKAVLQHNGKSFHLSHLGIHVQMKETHNSKDYLLSAVNYQEHKWFICGDLKVVG